MDTESRGVLDRAAVRAFVTVRCPELRRRDADLRKLQGTDSCWNTHQNNDNDSPTFDEIWQAVLDCCVHGPVARQGTTTTQSYSDSSSQQSPPSCHLDIIGVEGWMVLARFLALTQSLEANRRFSARHSQQTMRHKNSPNGSELVVVNVPPPEAPEPLTPQRLVQELQAGAELWPELDLDHSRLEQPTPAGMMEATATRQEGFVKLSLFGPGQGGAGDVAGMDNNGTDDTHRTLTPLTQPPEQSLQSVGDNMDFALMYNSNSSVHDNNSSSNNNNNATVVVRRSFSDVQWLHETFVTHRGLGGPLCGRILPPFPETLPTSLSSQAVVAKVPKGVVKTVKSFWGSTTKSTKSSKGPERSSQHMSVSKSYYNPYTVGSKARRIERYLNYLLEHPALSTSFPLQTILTVRIEWTATGLVGTK